MDPLTTATTGPVDGIAGESRAAERADTATDRAVELSQVSVSFGGLEVLSEISLSAKPDERIAVIGRSGAGKSTLLRLLNGSLSPGNGRIRLLGEDPNALNERRLRALRSRIGTVHQQLLLIPRATVFHNVLSGGLGRMSLLVAAAAFVRRREADKVAAILSEVGLLPKMYERVDALSGGEQQRVAIARALYQDPQILLADEPLASLDPRWAAKVVDSLMKVASGRTLILSTHQLDPVLSHMSRVIALCGARVLFDKRQGEVTRDDIAHTYDSECVTPAGTKRAAVIQSEPERLVVTAGRTVSEQLLPDLVAAFLREHPRVRVAVVTREDHESAAALVAGRADLGVIGSPVTERELQSDDLTQDEIIAVAAPTFAGLPVGLIPPSVVAQLQRIDAPPGSASRKLVERHFAGVGSPLAPSASVCEANNLSTVRSALLAGVGIAFVSRLAFRGELAEGSLRELEIDTGKIHRQIGFARRRGEPLSPAASRFIALAKSRFTDPEKPTR
jgi:phosphonate transport system ATP-binding protein